MGHFMIFSKNQLVFHISCKKVDFDSLFEKYMFIHQKNFFFLK